MKTWKVDLVHAEDLETYLNARSAEGWDALCVVHEPAYENYYRVVLFK